MKTELFVSLVVPDTTAITTKKTLERMGMAVASVRRYEYYAFAAQNNLFNTVATCDVLVNVNKHKAQQSIEKKDGHTYVLVKESEPAAGLQTMLNERFGMGIDSLERGIVWELACDEATAEKITEELLHNTHYQEYILL